jgi:hypothetical protein
MDDALKRYLEPKVEKVEQTFLSAHNPRTGTFESCVWARYDSPPSPPLEKDAAIYWIPFRLADAIPRDLPGRA